MAWVFRREGIVRRDSPEGFGGGGYNSSSLRAQRLFFGLHAPKYVQKIRRDVVRVRLQISEPLAQNAVVFASGTPLGLPDSRDIRLAVQAGCGSSQIRLAVFRTRDARVGIVRPLRISTREGSGKSDSHERDDNSSMKHQFTYSRSPSHRERPRASHRSQSLAVRIRPAP